MRKSRIKTISNKAFHKMWSKAFTFDSEKEFLDFFLHYDAKPPVDFAKMNLDYVEALEILKRIYTASHLDFKEIMEIASLRTSQISDTFCIPIRTVEDWKSGKRECNPYIRLMILKHYHLLGFGRYIRLASETEYLSTFPPVYEPRQATFKETCTETTGEPIAQVSEDLGAWENYYSSVLKRHVPKERTPQEREFFKKYGFFPD